MTYAQTGSVVVSTAKGTKDEFPWATSVRVDRKFSLHVYGHHKQHKVYLEGEWAAYVVSAPTRAEILGDA